MDQYADDLAELIVQLGPQEHHYDRAFDGGGEVAH